MKLRAKRGVSEREKAREKGKKSEGKTVEVPLIEVGGGGLFFFDEPPPEVFSRQLACPFFFFSLSLSLLLVSSLLSFSSHLRGQALDDIARALQD